MKDSIIQVNIDSIKNNYNEMTKNFDELLEMCKRYREMIQGTASICDTQTAKLYREFAQKYLDYRISKLENEFREKIDLLTDIVKIYNEEDCSIKKAINGE